MPEKLDRNQLSAVVTGLNQLMAKAVNEATQLVNALFRRAGATLGFRVLMGRDDTLALLYEPFGSCFFVRAIDGGVVVTSGLNEGSDLQAVDGGKIARLVGTLICRTRSALTPEAMTSLPEQLTMLRAEDGRTIAMLTDGAGNCYLAASKVDARKRLTALQNAGGKISPEGYTRLEQAIGAATLLPPMPQLNTERIPLPTGQKIELVLDGDWIVEAKFV